jgi:hypothetical protein
MGTDTAESLSSAMMEKGEQGAWFGVGASAVWSGPLAGVGVPRCVAPSALWFFLPPT